MDSEHTRYDWDGGTIPAPYPPPPPPQVIFIRERRRRRWPWVLGALGLVLVVCCGVGAAATVALRKQWPAHFAIGNEVAGLDRLDDPATRLIADDVEAHLRNIAGVNDAIAVGLRDPNQPDRIVVFLGAARLSWNPSGDLDAVVRSAGHRLGPVTPYTTKADDYVLRCADSTDDQGQPVVDCAFVDHGATGVALCYGGRPMDGCAALLAEIRRETVVRG